MDEFRQGESQHSKDKDNNRNVRELCSTAKADKALNKIGEKGAGLKQDNTHTHTHTGSNKVVREKKSTAAHIVS